MTTLGVVLRHPPWMVLLRQHSDGFWVACKGWGAWEKHRCRAGARRLMAATGVARRAYLSGTPAYSVARRACLGGRGRKHGLIRVRSGVPGGCG